MRGQHPNAITCAMHSIVTCNAQHCDSRIIVNRHTWEEDRNAIIEQLMHMARPPAVLGPAVDSFTCSTMLSCVLLNVDDLTWCWSATSCGAAGDKMRTALAFGDRHGVAVVRRSRPHALFRHHFDQELGRIFVILQHLP